VPSAGHSGRGGMPDARGRWRGSYLSISEAYEKIVATLERHARPSDDYLLSLDEDERDAAFDSAHDVEKRAEKLFADALANKQLTRWRMLNDGTMVRVSVVEEWKPRDLGLGVPGLDSHLPDFTDRLLSRFDRLPARPRKRTYQRLVDRGGPVKLPDRELPA
jgi:hypothetical protein